MAHQPNCLRRVRLNSHNVAGSPATAAILASPASLQIKADLPFIWECRIQDPWALLAIRLRRGIAYRVRPTFPCYPLQAEVERTHDACLRGIYNERYSIPSGRHRTRRESLDHGTRNWHPKPSLFPSGRKHFGGMVATFPAWADRFVTLDLPGGPNWRDLTTAFPQKGQMILQRTSPLNAAL